MSVRTRFLLLTGLLILALGATVITANATLGALQTVHREEVLKSREDVGLIQPWMTIPYIAHVYHVPERTFYQPLHLQNDPTIRHSTLQVIATHQRQPVEIVIHKVQDTILSYRRAHPDQRRQPGPPPTPIVKKGALAVH